MYRRFDDQKEYSLVYLKGITFRLGNIVNGDLLGLRQPAMTQGLHKQPFDFQAYRQAMLANLIALRKELPQHELDEQAIPSYTHPNPLMAWLFWQRLKHVIQYPEARNLTRVLEFGSGGGVLFPYPADRCEQLFALDIHDQARRSTIRRMGLEGVRLLDPAASLSELEPSSVDTIIALDVLEHVQDPPEVCHTFATLLSPRGQILISGPTETVFYRVGRRLASFKTHCHKRNMYDIEAALRNYFEVRLIGRLYPPVELFRICIAQHPGSSSQ